MEDITEKEKEELSDPEIHERAIELLEIQKTQKAPYQEIFQKVFFGAMCFYDSKQFAIVGKYDDGMGFCTEYFYQSKAMNHLDWVDGQTSARGGFLAHGHITINKRPVGLPLIDPNPEQFPDYDAVEAMTHSKELFIEELDDRLKRDQRIRDTADSRLEQFVSELRKSQGRD